MWRPLKIPAYQLWRTNQLPSLPRKTPPLLHPQTRPYEPGFFAIMPERSADPFQTPEEEGLTPMRIRGKRYRKGDKPQRKGRGELRSVRRKLDATDDPSSVAESDQHGAEQESRPGQRKLARIEQFPPELLEQIFWHCPDSYLPATSLPLCRALSGLDNIKKQLYHSLFTAPLPDGTFPTHDFSQSALLRLRWLTFPFLKTILGDVVPSKLYLFDPGRRSAPDVPAKLLRPPWTEDKVLLLDFLLNAGATIDRIGSCDGELASDGLLDAVRTGHVAAVNALLMRPVGRQINIRTFPPTPSKFSYSYEGVAPEVKHLRAAVIAGGCNKAIVTALIDNASQFEKLRDPEIYSWVHEKKQQGNEIGYWLEAKLRARVAWEIYTTPQETRT